VSHKAATNATKHLTSTFNSYSINHHTYQSVWSRD